MRISVRQAAEVMGVAHTTVARLLKQKKLPRHAGETYCIESGDLIEYIKRDLEREPLKELERLERMQELIQLLDKEGV